MRLVSALLVILSHCYGPLDPIGRVTNGELTGSGIAMPVFFFLSGLLVAQSLDRSPSRANFLWKRFIRLYPAAVAVVILAACLVGPIVTNLPLKTYFAHPLLYRYLRTCLLVEVYYQLPGVFGHSPLGTSVNASLWSLTLEWKCYAGLFVLSFLKDNIRYRLLIGLALVLLLIATFFYPLVELAGKRWIHPGFVLGAYTGLGVFFLAGAFVYHHSPNITIRPWWLPAVLVLGGLSAMLGIFPTALYFLLPALILWLAVSGTGLVRRLTPKPDLSYGFFCWGFPVEQLTVNYIHPSSPTALFALTVLLTLPLACLSWYCIESPALRTKKRFAKIKKAAPAGSPKN